MNISGGVSGLEPAPVQETQETRVQSLGQEGQNGNPLEYSCLKRILWTEEPGGLQSIGLQRVRQTGATSVINTSWAPQWLRVKVPPASAHEQRSLAGCSPGGRKKVD